VETGGGKSHRRRRGPLHRRLRDCAILLAIAGGDDERVSGSRDLAARRPEKLKELLAACKKFENELKGSLE